jgi:hypothetical protein
MCLLVICAGVGGCGCSGRREKCAIEERKGGVCVVMEKQCFARGLTRRGNLTRSDPWQTVLDDDDGRPRRKEGGEKKRRKRGKWESGRERRRFL